MLISELIEELEIQLIKHGDVPVYTGGSDYPGPVTGVGYVKAGRGDGYNPEHTVTIHGGI